MWDTDAIESFTPEQLEFFKLSVAQVAAQAAIEQQEHDLEELRGLRKDSEDLRVLRRIIQQAGEEAAAARSASGWPS